MHTTPQSLKDAIVVTAGGAETLPFLASFCVLPASLAFFVLYGKLVRAHHPAPHSLAAQPLDRCCNTTAAPWLLGLVMLLAWQCM